MPNAATLPYSGIAPFFTVQGFGACKSSPLFFGAAIW